MPTSDKYDALLRDILAVFPRRLDGGDKIDLDDVLREVTGAAVHLIGGVDYADVLLIEEDRFDSKAATATVASDLDEVQRQLGEGPCLEAAVAESVIRSPDLRHDTRWPRFGPAAVERGVHSILSYQLFASGRQTGALNLLGRAPQTFAPEAEALGAMLASHAAVAFGVVNRHRQFRSALASRDLIGQAKGIVMERFGIDAVAAFDLLKRLS
ncbi:MAG: GAF and ANTAR domain-containing protein, partial [Mycobacterium sp.]|nr:GAF and ANTAR domain-containing protein [Mycobacterium sp.]